MVTSPKQILKLSSTNENGESLEEVWIVREGNVFSIKRYFQGKISEKNAPDSSTTYGSIEEALDAPELNKKWVRLRITTSLKLHEIERHVLKTWGAWRDITSTSTSTSTGTGTSANANTYITIPEAEASVANTAEMEPFDTTITINDKSYHRLVNPRNYPTKESLGVSFDNNLNDSDARLVKYLYACEKNTKEYQRLKQQVKETLKNKGYISYTGDSRDFGGLNCTGMSIIYKVPTEKRGNLAQFKGQKIRVCCIGSGDRALRQFLAGPVTEPAMQETMQTKDQVPYIGFLAPLKPILDMPTDLHLILENRLSTELQNFTINHKLSDESINAIETSSYCQNLAAEGNIAMLKCLRTLGVSLATKKDPTPPGTIAPKNEYWHTLLWTIAENCPSKTKELIELYSQKEFKSLLKDGDITSSLPAIKSIILTERQRRLKKNLENISQGETINI